MCCKLLTVETLKKASGVWCPHCRIGSGCAIYESRPDECRSFFCNYLIDETLDERWKPSDSRLVLWWNPQMSRLSVVVDPQRPDAWKREPYYSLLKKVSSRALAENRQVLIYVGLRAWAVLPDRDVDLGDVPDGHLVVVQRSFTAAGTRYDAIVLPPDDPRAASFKTTFVK
jgi:hypothetical protein